MSNKYVFPRKFSLKMSDIFLQCGFL